MQFKSVNDIREYKTALRDRFKYIRKSTPEQDKIDNDNSIFKRLISLNCYESCRVVLTYVSTVIEVDTIKLIKYSLEKSKIVAVPKCIEGTRNMKFYIIKSMDDLETGMFSVLEPKVDICQELTDFTSAICIVPGLSFDMYGYRLGYGKGYYDRFLQEHMSIKEEGQGKTSDLYKVIGLCYCSCTVNNLMRGKYDVPVNALITEKYTYTNISKY